MAKGRITLSHGGFAELIKSLEAFPALLDNAVDAGIKAMGKQAISDVKASYLANVNGADTSDYVYKSLDGYSTTIAEGKLPWTSAGSFEYVAGIGDIRSVFGKTPKEMNPPQIAYWLEHGTQRLVTGAAKPRKQSWADVDLVQKRVAISPTSFISKAAIKGWDSQQQAFADAFNKTIR